ncbi:MAG TPA: glutathione S-transferase N-terminal domain-containing protein [Mariprofundaceae bacterium]|nr:glutathione S-transferase N-terminal domain-containing protein [Mariprofundaceae bacterium]
MIKLFSNPASPDSHRTRIVLAEKELPTKIIDVDPENLPAELLQLNPYGRLPTVVDRDIVFFEASVVCEYLDDRYPHPPLKPGSPAERAQMRLAVMRIEQELYPLYDSIERVKRKTDQMKKLRSWLETLDSYMARQEYFVGETYSLADITIAPILWRLPSQGIDTGRMRNLERYMKSLFERPAFERSLSEYEQMLRDR